ncbi:MAG: replication endonuclease, partial [Pseudomonadota bacterium]
LAALAALGTANKSIRRGELMARIRGFEEIAKDVGHLGVFSTITCPSKFHSVGGTNPKYDGSTPRDAQAHLNGVWAAIRTSLHRKGIHAYGFRIAEPHTDGCPHWHMLMFIESAHLETYENTIKRYALAEDGDETGAQKNRVKIVRIEAGQGTAAGYIAKYVGKNIDGECVGDHKDKHGNVLVNDMFGNQEFTPSQRVTYWSQTWGIRQFQQIGGAPIGVWRELRRIKAETVQNAPEAIKAAWHAVQKIDNADLSAAKQADFAAYTRAQGGVFVGRRACIKIAKRMTMVEGRYATREEGKPCGVYHVKNENAVYESVRYTWTKKEGGDVAVAVPWTGVNNCTTTGQNAPWTRVKTSPSEKNFSRDSFVASENDQWSKKWEKIDVETYQNHRKNKTNSHLAELQRKHKDE